MRPPTCAPAAVGAGFTGDATYKSVAAIRTFDGIETGTLLVVETPRGFVVTPVDWGADSPLDPGCPSIVRDYKVKSLRVEHAHLVAVTSGHRNGMDEKGNWFEYSLDGAYWCKKERGELACKRYMAQYNGDIGDFAISPGGTIRLLGPSREE